MVVARPPRGRFHCGVDGKPIAFSGTIQNSPFVVTAEGTEFVEVCLSTPHGHRCLGGHCLHCLHHGWVGNTGRDDLVAPAVRILGRARFCFKSERCALALGPARGNHIAPMFSRRGRVLYCVTVSIHVLWVSN